MEQQQEDKQYTEDDPLRLLLNPEAYIKYKQDEMRKQQELTDEEKVEIDK